jgi:ribosome-binding protein aMBF1 (putative translation factor)
MYCFHSLALLIIIINIFLYKDIYNYSNIEMNSEPKDIVLKNPALRAKKLENSTKQTFINETTSGKKITDDDELPVSDKVGIDIGKQIMQARLAKNLKQADLAKQLNMTPDVIRDYENGSAIRNNNILNKIKRALNINTAK